jgi:hypothetical protein
MRYTFPQTWKAWVALIGAVITALIAIVADFEIDLPELAAFAGAIGTAWAVFKKRNAS